MEVNNNNIEEQILLYVDGELDVEEAAALLQYLALHPEWRSLLNEYQSLVLPPDNELVFEGKEALLQPEPQVMPFRKTTRPVWIRRAAAVVLIAGATALTWQLGKQGEGLALPDTTHIALLQQPENTVAADTAKPVRQVVQVRQTAARRAIQPAPRQAGSAPLQAQPQQLARDQAVQIAPLQGAGTATIALAEGPQPARELQRPEALAAETPEAVAVKAETLPDWLPVNDEKLEGVNDLIAHIREVKNKVAARAAELRKSTFVIRLGEKEIAFGK